MYRRGYGILAATIFSLLLLFFLYSIAEVLLLFFIGVLFSLYLGGITDTLQRRLSAISQAHQAHGLSRHDVPTSHAAVRAA